METKKFVPPTPEAAQGIVERFVFKRRGFHLSKDPVKAKEQMELIRRST